MTRLHIQVSLLHTNPPSSLNFQRCKCAFASPITKVSSCVRHTLSHACILYKGLYSCILYFTVLYGVQQYSIFTSSPGCPEASVKAEVIYLVQYYPDITWSFFQKSRLNWIQQGTRTQAIDVRPEWNCSLPSISCCWWSFSSTISHCLCLLQSVTLFACSLDASPFMLLYFSRYCTIR